MSFYKFEISTPMQAMTDAVINDSDYEALKKLIIARKPIPKVIQQMNDLLEREYLQHMDTLGMLVEGEVIQQSYETEINQIREYYAQGAAIYQAAKEALSELELNIIHLKSQQQNSDKKEAAGTSEELTQINELIIKREKQLSKINEILARYKDRADEHQKRVEENQELISKLKNDVPSEKQLENNPLDVNKSENPESHSLEFDKIRFNDLMRNEYKDLESGHNYSDNYIKLNSYDLFLSTLESNLNKQNDRLSDSEIDTLKQLINLNKELNEKNLEREQIKSRQLDLESGISAQRRKLEFKKYNDGLLIDLSIQKIEKRFINATYTNVISGFSLIGSVLLLAAFATNPLLLIIPGIFLAGFVISGVVALTFKVQQYLLGKEKFAIEKQEFKLTKDLNEQKKQIENELVNQENRIKSLQDEINSYGTSGDSEKKNPSHFKPLFTVIKNKTNDGAIREVKAKKDDNDDSVLVEGSTNTPKSS